jgi:ketosteroid isomerase-like protein
MTKLSVEDRLDIMDLIARYYWALDLGDAEGAAACYAEDGYLDHLWQGKLVGREAIARAFNELYYDRPSWWFARQHRLNNVIVDKAGDGAHVKAMFSILQHNVYYRTNFVFGLGTVDIELGRHDGEWRFEAFKVNAWITPEDVPWQGDRRAWDVSGMTQMEANGAPIQPVAIDIDPS